MSHGAFMDVIMRLCVRNIGHECFMCLIFFFQVVTCNAHDVFNHTHACRLPSWPFHHANRHYFSSLYVNLQVCPEFPLIAIAKTRRSGVRNKLATWVRHICRCIAG